MYYVYHIHLDGMGLDQGYVGISKEPKRRWCAHKSRKENPYLARVFEKYGDKVKYTILTSFEDVEDALWQEYTLRPFDRMGWNITKGGGKPPVNTRSGSEIWNFGKETPPEVKQKISEALSGRVRSEAHCKKISENKTGAKHHMAKVANVYLKDGTLVAEGVNLSCWSKDNGYSRTGLHKTIQYPNRTYKGMYARYVDSG